MSEFDRNVFEEMYSDADETLDHYDMAKHIYITQQAKIDELEFKLSSTVNNFDNSCKTIAIHQKFLDDADVANKFLTDRVDGLQDEIQGYKRIYGELELKRDELQARVDKALERMDAESSNSWGLWKEKSDMYDQGASDAYERSYWILKGNKDG